MQGGTRALCEHNLNSLGLAPFDGLAYQTLRWRSTSCREAQEPHEMRDVVYIFFVICDVMHKLNHVSLGHPRCLGGCWATQRRVWRRHPVKTEGIADVRFHQGGRVSVLCREPCLISCPVVPGSKHAVIIWFRGSVHYTLRYLLRPGAKEGAWWARIIIVAAHGPSQLQGLGLIARREAWDGYGASHNPSIKKF